jgi:hypothetical protein
MRGARVGHAGGGLEESLPRGARCCGAHIAALPGAVLSTPGCSAEARSGGSDTAS